MKRLLSHVVTRVKESWNRPTIRRPHVTQLKLEQLQDRLVPSAAAYVNPAALIDFNNVYGDFRSAYTVTGNVQHGSNSRLVADVQQLQKHDHTGMQAITAAGSTVRTDAASLAAMDSFNGAFTPQEMQHAYGFDNIAFGNGTIAADGSGQTIAIVDVGTDPNIASDLHNFDVAYGLPDPNFTESQQYFGQDGGVVAPDPGGGWEFEEALDVEWAHAMAPGASILLVETNNLFGGVQWAASQPGVSVVSMSWTLGGYGADSLFTTPAGHAGVTFVGAAGDGGTFSYPASSPTVLGVGGTTLSLDASGSYGGETVWNDGNGGLSSGGGPDPNYPVKPGPDVAYNAGTPVWIYDSFNNSQNPWLAAVGTSAGAPQWAALIAIADQGLALNGVGPLDGATQTIPMLNNLAGSAFHTDIPGSNGNGFSGPAVVGLGTPYANLVIEGLVQQGTPPPTTGYAVGELPGLGGVWRWSSTAGWEQLSPFDATQVGIDAAGDVVGEFPALGGVWRFEDATGWQQLTGANASSIAIAGNGNVVVEIQGGGVYRFEDATGWQQLSPFDATQVGIDAAGEVVGEFPALGGVWRFEDATGWQQLTVVNASQVSITTNGDVLGEFPALGGVWLFRDSTSWQQLTTADATSISLAWN